MDEFSFPTIAADQENQCHPPFPHFSTSPLWFPSTASAKGFAMTTAASEYKPDENRDGPLVDEEKMDMLWEDFNEELHCCSKSGDTASDSLTTEPDIGRHRCSPLFRVATRAGGASYYSRLSLVLLSRIFKKLFVIQKTSSARR